MVLGHLKGRRAWVSLLLAGGLALLLLPAYATPARVKLIGTVTDADTKKPIAGANVSFKNLKIGTTTDENGRYEILLPLGEHIVVFSAIGYRSNLEVIRMADDRRVDMALLPTAQELEEVIVTGKTADHNVKDVQMGVVQLDMLSMRRIPVVLGEVDIIKTLTLQPGVTTVGEGAGGFNVRGGRTDQNLVLLDGAPLYNTSHLLGFFSSVNPDVVQNVTLYKGNFSAKYGGRASSLLEMNTKDGNGARHQFSVGVSPVSGRVYAEGPLLKNKLTYVAGGRVAYPNWVINLFPRTRGYRAAFYDVNAKLAYQINKTNRIALSAYRSYDDFKFLEDTLYAWNTNLASLQWSTALSPSLLFTFNGVHTDYASSIEGLQPATEYRISSTIRHRELKAGLLYSPVESHKLEVGGNVIWYSLQPGDQRPTTGGSNVNSVALQPEFAREVAAYVSDEIAISPLLTLQLGLRYSAFAQLGNRQVYSYDESLPRSPESITDTTRYAKGQTIQTYAGWEPRSSLRIGFNDQNAVKVSYNRMRQYLHLISNTTAISPVDFWKISDSYVPPQLVDQVSVGFFRNFLDNAWETSVEGFYKDFRQLVEYKNGARLLMNPLLEADLLPAKGKAYGVEMSIRNNKGKVTGQLSYTYSRSLVAVRTDFASEQINDGDYFPSVYDKPHNLTWSGQVQLGRNWTLGTNFVYSTGRPATFPDGLYAFNNSSLVNYSRRNANRIADYHRLDVSIAKDTRRKKEQRHYSTWNLAFYNLYGRKNPYSVYFTQFGGGVNAYRLSVFGSVIPSLTLNFYFL
jgi:hypothetical protein